MKLPVRTRVEFRGETYDFDCDTFTHLVGEKPRLCALTGVEIREGNATSASTVIDRSVSP